MESLIFVVMDNNQIEDLSDFFESDFPLMEMEWISFENNNIKKVPNFMFKNIKSIYFNCNPLTEFESLILPEYPELYDLFLKDTHISKFRLPRMPKFEKIVMDDSKVENLDWLISSASKLPMLSQISMKNCIITTLPNLDEFQSLKEL